MEATTAFWSWNGKYVGSRVSDFLFNIEGHQVGYFAEGDEVYGCDGSYIGEVRGGNRLITNLSKRAWRRRVLTPQVQKTHAREYPGLAPKEMLNGFEEFLAV